ncbi:MAG: ornithine--oxo-acid transaminase [Candidatus Sungiibacteriota bacterium]|uniref:ornithine aminotransferase n=1 Tax=Candidatus Sungiibacteriota bacterium TaxID=2750080 RepID=A0A7T5RK27_9BACT|nr:MAG: ornithine--oxo-acid transaminase [Candidatus Sungbacteria bacterium]
MSERTLTIRELVELAYKYLPRNYDPPDDLVVSRGQGVLLYDVEDRVFVDLLSCYSALAPGHVHPQILKAIIRQAGKLTANANCLWEEQKILCAKELAEFTGMDKVLFMTSGAEVFDSAVKLARKWAYTRKDVYTEKVVPKDQAEIVVCKNNFHGRTIGAISASTVPQYYDLFGPPVPGFKKIPFGDARAFEEAINPNTAAIIVEPIQGEGGILVPPDGYLNDVRQICDAHHVLMILDEVQTGLGRTGKMFAYMHDGSFPDAMLLGKGLGGGLGISAVVGINELMDVFEPGDHGSTFGGNPLACAVAREEMHLLVRENLPQRAAELGEFFISELKNIYSPYIKEVRGRGLLVGIELRPEAGGAARFVDALRGERILCKDAHENVIRFSPPLIIEKDVLKLALIRIAKVFRTL